MPAQLQAAVEVAVSWKERTDDLISSDPLPGYFVIIHIFCSCLRFVQYKCRYVRYTVGATALERLDVCTCNMGPTGKV